MKDADKRKVQHDLMARNIITSGLSPNEFFRVVKCKTAKEIWEVLETTHEANLCLMTNMDDDAGSSKSFDTSSEYEVSSDLKELHDAFNELHIEAKRLSTANKKLRENLKWHVDKLASMQQELNSLKSEFEMVTSNIALNDCVYHDFDAKVEELKTVQLEFDVFKKSHFEKCHLLQNKVSHLENLLNKAYEGKRNLNEILSVQRMASNKTGLGYNKQTKFAPFNKVNLNQVSNKIIEVSKTHQIPNGITCHYCMKKGHTKFKCNIRKYGVPHGLYVWLPKCNVSVAAKPLGPKLKWVPATSN